MLTRLNPRLRVLTAKQGEIRGLYYWDTRWSAEHSSFEHRSEGNFRLVGRLHPAYQPERTVKYHDGNIFAWGWRELLHRLATQGLIKLPPETGGYWRILHRGTPGTINKQGSLVLQH